MVGLGEATEMVVSGVVSTVVGTEVVAGQVVAISVVIGLRVVLGAGVGFIIELILPI